MKKNNIDAIIVLTPTNQHATQVIELIKYGIPIICEKSLSTSIKETIEIEKTLNKNNGFLAVIFNYLGYPIIRELKHLIAIERLGKINHIQIEMPQEGFARITNEGNPIIPQKWRMKDNRVPTISLDLGVHLHMFIKYLTNETPNSVVAQSNSYGNFSSIVDNVLISITYPSTLIIKSLCAIISGIESAFKKINGNLLSLGFVKAIVSNVLESVRITCIEYKS